MENDLKFSSSVIVEDKIFVIRGIQVMIDRDLARLYQVETKVLNQAVKRNYDSFPDDFMFRLSDDEKNKLVTNCDRFKQLKHSSSNPFVFTEQGVYMLATILKSKIAREVNISIMRTFVKLKNQSVPYFDIIKRIEALEIEDNKTKELLSKIVDIVTSMQDIQEDAKEGTKKVGFIP